MKILPVFLLSSVFVLLPATGVVPLFAQTSFHLSQMKDCGFAPALKVYTVDLHGRVDPMIVGYLEDGQNCLNDNQMLLKASVEDLQSPMISSGDLETDILDLRDKLKQAKADLDTAKADLDAAKVRIDVLEHISAAWDRLFAAESAQMGRRPASKPKAAASKPKAPVNKPKPAVKEGTH